MLRIDGVSTRIDLELDNGIYIFSSESATGKTRLAKLMKKYGMYGYPVASYTYDDYKYLDTDIKTVLNPNKYKAIILDRYDLYSCQFEEEISKYKEDMIILIDCKVKNKFKFLIDTCYIDMSIDYIKVNL